MSDVFNLSSESEPFCHIEFRVVKNNVTLIHEADCGTLVKILGLKLDLETVLQLPHTHQEWYLRDRKMDDHKTLEDYGISGTAGTGRNIIQIYIYDKRKTS